MFFVLCFCVFLSLDERHCQRGEEVLGSSEETFVLLFTLTFDSRSSGRRVSVRPELKTGGGEPQTVLETDKDGIVKVKSQQPDVYVVSPLKKGFREGPSFRAQGRLERRTDVRSSRTGPSNRWSRVYPSWTLSNGGGQIRPGDRLRGVNLPSFLRVRLRPDTGSGASLRLRFGPGLRSKGLRIGVPKKMG